MTKRGLHTIHHRPQFSQMWEATQNMVKKILWIRQKSAYFGERISQKRFFAKYSRIWLITLYTLSTFHTDFVRSFLFRHCLRIMCSRLFSLIIFSNYRAFHLSKATSTYWMEQQLVLPLHSVYILEDHNAWASHRDKILTGLQKISNFQKNIEWLTKH